METSHWIQMKLTILSPLVILRLHQKQKKLPIKGPRRLDFLILKTLITIKGNVHFPQDLLQPLVAAKLITTVKSQHIPVRQAFLSSTLPEEKEIAYPLKIFQDLANIYISRSLRNMCKQMLRAFGQRGQNITQHWADFIETGTLNRDSRLNALKFVQLDVAVTTCLFI